MSERARRVLEWIDALDQRQGTILDLGWEDIIAESRLAPGQVLLIGKRPELPTFLDLLSAEVQAFERDAQRDEARAAELRARLGFSRP